jgi:arylsulfatase A-like enzyme
MDDNIGRVLQALDASARQQHHCHSDNGGERFSNVWPFSSMKQELLEAGIRVPAMVRWPGPIALGAVSERKR